MKRLKPLGAEASVKHGHTRFGNHTPEYRSWRNTVQRCYNPRHKYYLNYGARGIAVCDRWRNSFEAFLEGMGPRPAGTTLGRFGDEGNYEPGNVKWMTWAEQGAEKRKKLSACQWKKAA